ncbi:MAG TPA: HypC/HybG/HupF family hydrogenase formation chaperone [Bacteroidales bacterium]|nr:HypC/HybG/HupF family hydrogenase formation chaperone [Bacteroidales bacterium]
MCLAVPGKVISIDASDPDLKMAKVQFGGVVQDICVQWIDDLNTGDYVMAHVGVALNKVDEEDARITLNALYEMREIDFNFES